MVFSSIPAYLDPSNWQQQQNHHLQFHHHQITGSSGGALSSVLPPPQQTPGGPPNSIRPGSMTERARMANIPMPETALKCPRCDSTNTKFCYFNNYSLTQPRHFCKTCRRYWTRGGALRSIPVGGGCRRNTKRSKSSSARSKSPAITNHQSGIDSGTNSVTSSGLQILASSNFANHFINPSDLSGSTEMGLNYGEMMISPLGNSLEPWRFQQMQQFSLFGGGGGGFMFNPLEGSGGDEVVGAKDHQLSSFGVMNNRGSVKLEDNQEMNLSRRFLGMLGNNNGDQCSNNWNNGSTNNTTSSTSTSAWANNLPAGFN